MSEQRTQPGQRIAKSTDLGEFRWRNAKKTEHYPLNSNVSSEGVPYPTVRAVATWGEVGRFYLNIEAWRHGRLIYEQCT